MRAYWHEQRADEVPAGDAWLSEGERLLSEAFRIAKRRTDWRLGRWTAKLALASLRGISIDEKRLAEIEIRASASGAPEVLINGVLAEVGISLSHSNGSALCVIGPAQVRLGCDIEAIEERSNAFVGDYFTPGEREFIASVPPSERTLVVNMFWSAKESALKAIGVGLRADTRSVGVALDKSRVVADKWSGFTVDGPNATRFYGVWSEDGSLVRTIVFSEPQMDVKQVHVTGKVGCGLVTLPEVVQAEY